MRSQLLSDNALGLAWEKALVLGDNTPAQGEVVLALALAYPKQEWDAVLVGPEKQSRPPLHWALSKTLSTEQNTERKRRPLSLSDDSWPADVGVMSPWERLAAHLIRQGADPWIKDGEGLDALDWAFRSGSRSVMGLLFAHPQCPPLEALQARTDAYPGRRVPWIHGAVYRGHLHLFQDLLDQGWSKHAVDQQGWTALSWVNSPSVLDALVPHYDFLSDDQKLELRQSWVRRGAMKLYRPHLSLSPLIEGFEKTFPLGEDALQSSEDQKTLTNLLAIKPGSANRYKGVSVDAVLGGAAKDFDAFFEKNWGVVGTGSGSTKGAWTLPLAGLWAGMRKESDQLPAIATAFVNRLQAGAAPEWLNAVMRPADKQGQGRVVRGGLAWFVVASMRTRDGYDKTTTDRLLALEAAWEQPNPRLRGLAEAVEFSASYCGPTASSDWKEALSRRWGHAIVNAFRTGELLDAEAEQWARLGGLGWSSYPIYAERWSVLAERLVRQPVAAPDKGITPSGRYQLLWALLNPEQNLLRRVEAFSAGSSSDSWKKVRTLQLKLLHAFLAAHNGLDAAPMPSKPLFTPEAYTRMLGENSNLASGLPSAATWESFVRSRELDKSLPQATPSVPKPRF